MRLAWQAAAITAFALVAGRVEAQETGRWHARLDAGYANSLDAPADSPGGGPLVSGFVGYRLGRLVTLGASLGWHQYVNGRTTLQGGADCPPPAPPGPGCIQVRDATENAFEFTAALRVGPHAGTWRPFGQLALGGYRFNEEVRFERYDPTGEVLLGAFDVSPEDYTGFGGSVGAGLGFAPSGGPLAITASLRLHATGNSRGGEFGTNNWVEPAIGVSLDF